MTRLPGTASPIVRQGQLAPSLPAVSLQAQLAVLSHYPAAMARSSAPWRVAHEGLAEHRGGSADPEGCDLREFRGAGSLSSGTTFMLSFFVSFAGEMCRLVVHSRLIVFVFVFVFVAGRCSFRLCFLRHFCASTQTCFMHGAAEICDVLFGELVRIGCRRGNMDCGTRLRRHGEDVEDTPPPPVQWLFAPSPSRPSHHRPPLRSPYYIPR